MPDDLTPETEAGEAGVPAVYSVFWMAVVLVVILLAGALFGYDQGVISGALTGIQHSFALGGLLLEVVTSWVTLGAMLGSLAGGWLADHYGRRASIMTAAALFCAGAAIEAFAPITAVLVAGRLMVGFGVGVAAVAAPLYGAELAPAALRGRFVSAYQLAITVGIFQRMSSTAGWPLQASGG